MRNHIPKTATIGYKQIVHPGKKMKAAFALLLIPGLFFIALSRGFCSAEDHLDDSLAVAMAWIGQIDKAQYEDSYQAAGDALHEKVPEKQWDAVLSTLRSPWGEVISRKQLSHIYKPNGYEGSEGEFMVITYDTTFRHMNAATEVVVLKWEDGSWKGAGYNCGPKVVPGQDQAPVIPPGETETHTDPHVTPQPQ